MSKTIFESLDKSVGESYSKTTIVTERREIVNFDVAVTQDGFFIEFYCENLRVVIKSLDCGHVFWVQIRDTEQVLRDWEFTQSDIKKMSQIFALIQ